MKINTNFSPPPGKILPYLTGVFWLLSAVTIVVSIALYVSASNISAELPELEERLARYKGREIQKPVELLPSEKLVDLRARIRNVNDLSSATGQTLPQLFTRLEKLMPDGVWLVTLQYRSHENEAKLVAESNHGEHLTEFMGKLESSGYFSQVLLTRQTQRTDGVQGAIQFEIQLKAKS